MQTTQGGEGAMKWPQPSLVVVLSEGTELIQRPHLQHS